MSGQVSVPADLKEMFEEMVESLALGSKAPLHTCVVSKQVVPRPKFNMPAGLLPLLETCAAFVAGSR